MTADFKLFSPMLSLQGDFCPYRTTNPWYMCSIARHVGAHLHPGATIHAQLQSSDSWNFSASVKICRFLQTGNSALHPIVEISCAVCTVVAFPLCCSGQFLFPYELFQVFRLPPTPYGSLLSFKLLVSAYAPLVTWSLISRFWLLQTPCHLSCFFSLFICFRY